MPMPPFQGKASRVGSSSNVVGSLKEEGSQHPLLSLSATSLGGDLPSVSANVHLGNLGTLAFLGFEDENSAVLGLSSTSTSAPTRLRTSLKLVDDHVLQAESDWDLRGIQVGWENAWEGVERIVAQDGGQWSIAATPLQTVVQDAFDGIILFYQEVIADKDGSLQEVATLLNEYTEPINPFLSRAIGKITEAW